MIGATGVGRRVECARRVTHGISNWPRAMSRVNVNPSIAGVIQSFASRWLGLYRNSIDSTLAHPLPSQCTVMHGSSTATRSPGATPRPAVRAESPANRRWPHWKKSAATSNSIGASKTSIVFDWMRIIVEGQSWNADASDETHRVTLIQTTRESTEASRVYRKAMFIRPRPLLGTFGNAEPPHWRCEAGRIPIGSQESKRYRRTISGAVPVKIATVRRDYACAGQEQDWKTLPGRVLLALRSCGNSRLVCHTECDRGPSGPDPRGIASSFGWSRGSASRVSFLFEADNYVVWK